MKPLSAIYVPAVCRLYPHCLHTLSQSHVFNLGEMGARSGAEAVNESSQRLLAEDVACSARHVAIFNERVKSSSQIHGRFCVILGQSVAEILYDHVRVVVGFHEPIRVVHVVLVDVLESSNGLPVQVLPALADIEPHSWEVGFL